jgi:WD40 repeat protein
MPEAEGVVWNLADGKVVSRIQGVHSTIFRVAFTPDNSQVVMAHWNGKVTFWNPSTGVAQGVIDGHEGRLEYLAVSPDGKYLATGTTSFSDAHSLGHNADISFRVFDLATKQLVHQHNYASTSEPHGGIWEIQFSPDGTRLLVAGEVFGGAMIDSGNVGFVDEFEVGAWEKQPRRLFNAPSQGSKAKTVRYSPDGRFIATGHQAVDIPRERWWDDPDNSVIRIWDAKTFKLVRTLRGHRGGIRTLDFSPDSRLLVSGNSYQWRKGVAVESVQYTIRLWDVEQGTELAQQQFKDTIQCVRFTSDGKSIVSGSGGLGQQPLIERWIVPSAAIDK